MKATIKDIAYQVGSNKVGFEDLISENPDWDPKQLESMVGKNDLHYANDNETAVDLSYDACLKLFDKYPELPEVIDGIIYCTVTSDYVFPQNSFILHRKLKLKKEIYSLDIGMGCSGFVYSLSVANGLLHSGLLKNILIVNAETPTKLINNKDRSVKPLFSDGAAVTWVTASDASGGLVDMDFGTMGSAYDTVWVPAGQFRMPASLETSIEKTDSNGNTRSLEQMHMDGMKLLPLVSSLVTKQIKSLLKRNEFSISDIDLFVFHQASKIALDSLGKRLKIPADKYFRNLDTIGNTSSASIPIALKDAMAADKIKNGDRIMISGFGVGFSWGTAIIEM